MSNRPRQGRGAFEPIKLLSSLEKSGRAYDCDKGVAPVRVKR